MSSNSGFLPCEGPLERGGALLGLQGGAGSPCVGEGHGLERGEGAGELPTSIPAPG